MDNVSLRSKTELRTYQGNILREAGLEKITIK
jgi:hypothetical protein